MVYAGRCFQRVEEKWFPALDSWNPYVALTHCLFFLLIDFLIRSWSWEKYSLVWGSSNGCYHRHKLIIPTSSTIIEDIRRSGDSLLAFFYFDPRHDAKRHIRGLLSSILVQLCNKSYDCWGLLSQLHTELHEGSEVPSEETLAEFLIYTLNVLQEVPVCLVVDAIDECPNTIGTPSPREKVLDLVRNLIKLRKPNLHICVTSGLEQDIRSVLEPLTSASLIVSLHEESGHKKDIIDYINSFVHSDREMGDWAAEDRYLVIESLSRRTGGMYGAPSISLSHSHLPYVAGLDGRLVSLTRCVALTRKAFWTL